MKSLSEVTDLLDETGERHVHSKVLAFGVTAAVALIVGLNLIVGSRPLTWPEAAILAALLVAPYGLDGFKTLLKLRYAVTGDTPPRRSSTQLRAIGATDGFEPS